jgi:hypothetical protein
LSKSSLTTLRRCQTTTPGTGTDFAVENHGTIVLLQPLTRAANEWIESNLPADRLHYAGAVVIEPRYLADIVDGIRADGLEVL